MTPWQEAVTAALLYLLRRVMPNRSLGHQENALRECDCEGCIVAFDLERTLERESAS